MLGRASAFLRATASSTPRPRPRALASRLALGGPSRPASPPRRSSRGLGPLLAARARRLPRLRVMAASASFRAPGAASDAAPYGFSSAFDSGNGELVSATADVLTVRMTEEPFTEKDGRRHFQWFHFRVTGARGRALKVVIQNAGDASYPDGWHGYEAFVSADRVRWRREPDTSYVDGELVATSGVLSGAIEYAGTETLAFGCFLDDNEEFQMTGTIDSVKIFDSALTAQQVRGLDAVHTITAGTDDAGRIFCPCEDDDSNNKSNNLLVVILCVVVIVGALIAGIFIFAMMKRRQKPAEPPSALPVHEPTAPQQPALASIKAEALGMMSEEPIAEPIAEAVPHGHVSGAEAAAMAAGEPSPQQSVGWGRRFAAWRAVAEPPPPPEAEFEPEC